MNKYKNEIIMSLVLILTAFVWLFTINICEFNPNDITDFKIENEFLISYNNN